ETKEKKKKEGSNPNQASRTPFSSFFEPLVLQSRTTFFCSPFDPFQLLKITSNQFDLSLRCIFSKLLFAFSLHHHEP
ncbi:hypothetical protein VIGAN_01163400, partial [Vigna angularis var. angularis]